VEPVLVAAALAGALAGFAASAIPGLHVNGLAALALALAPDAGAEGQVFLVAAFAAAPFGAALPGTFLGASGEEGALSALPAHALAREGRGVEAVALQAWGAMLGLLLALPLAAALRPFFAWLAPRLADWTPWLVLLVIALLVWSEPARPKVHRAPLATPVREGGAWVTHAWREGPLSAWAGRALALFVILLSGALGFAAMRLGGAAMLLPLLAGLFAAPELLHAARSRRGGPRAALRAPPVPLRALAKDAAPGALVAVVEGLVPGVSPSQAALLAPRAPTPERRLVRLAAVNGAAVVFTLLAWHALGRPRAGALVAAQAMTPALPWTQGAPPLAILDEAILVVGAALLALVLARMLSRPLARLVARAGTRRAALAGLFVLALGCLWQAGWVGLVVLAAATLVGFVPRRLGVRRSLGMGSILVPTLLRAWGIA